MTPCLFKCWIQVKIYTVLAHRNLTNPRLLRHISLQTDVDFEKRPIKERFRLDNAPTPWGKKSNYPVKTNITWTVPRRMYARRVDSGNSVGPRDAENIAYSKETKSTMKTSCTLQNKDDLNTKRKSILNASCPLFWLEMITSNAVKTASGKRNYRNAVSEWSYA